MNEWKNLIDNSSSDLKPLLLKAIEALEKISADFGTDYCDGNCLEAHEALAEIKAELEKE